MAEIPEGKANLVRASFEAGLKPPTIARTFGVSVSQVNRIIRSAEKSNARSG
jgi:transposase-like protein